MHGVVERTSNDIRMLVKHFQMVQTQIDHLTKVQKDLLDKASRDKHAYKISTLGVVLPLRILYILRDILRGLNKILNVLKIVALLRKRKRHIRKQL